MGVVHGATKYQGGYNFVESGLVQGCPMDVVIIGVDCLGGFPLAPTNPTPTLAHSGLEGLHGLHLHARVEWLDPLGCPLLKGLEDSSSTFGGPLPPTPTMVIMGITTLSYGIILGQPHPRDTIGLPFW